VVGIGFHQVGAMRQDEQWADEKRQEMENGKWKIEIVMTGTIFLC
jgi:hypothetical protein